MIELQLSPKPHKVSSLYYLVFNNNWNSYYYYYFIRPPTVEKIHSGESNNFMDKAAD